MSSKKMIFLVAISYLAFCNNTNVNQTSSQEYTYRPIHIDDIRQFVRESDSSTTIDAIVGKALRKDGREVFIELSIYGNYCDTSYLFIKDGFCIYTAIDTPFMEQKNCMEKPTADYFWYYPPGTLNQYSYINNYKTFAGECREVYLLERCYYDGGYVPFLRNYYGKNIGLIGAEVIDSSGVTTDRFLLSYAKIDGKEYGHLFPARNAAKSKTLLKGNLPLVWAINGRVIPEVIRNPSIVKY